MLKKYSSIVAAIAIIFPLTAVVLGIYTAIEVGSFWIFLYCLVPSVVFYILAQAFSKLLYATQQNQDNIKSLSDMLKRFDTKAPADATQKPKTAAASAQPKAVSIASEDTGATASCTYHADEANADYIICNKCGTRQRSNRTICLNCSTKFK